MLFKRLLILLALLSLINFDGFSQEGLVFKGLNISRYPNYPLSKVKTHLHRVVIWQDSILKLDTSTDTLSSLKGDMQFFSVNCKSLIFKEIIYTNSVYWDFINSSCRLALMEIHFPKIEILKRAFYMMEHNMPKYKLNMVGDVYFDWFMANENIYFIRLNNIDDIEEPDSGRCIEFLSKAKLKFQELVEK